jgi:hypothetical protein
MIGADRLSQAVACDGLQSSKQASIYLACAVSCLLLQAPGSMVAAGSAAVPPPQQPAGPPAHISMATADVSKVPADQKPALGALNNLFNFCMQAANTPGTVHATHAVGLLAASNFLTPCLAHWLSALSQPPAAASTVDRSGVCRACCTAFGWLLYCSHYLSTTARRNCQPFLLLCAAKKREMDDNSRRIGTLFWKLNEGQVVPHVLQKLLQLCAALDAGNWPAAAHIQVGAGLGLTALLTVCCWGHNTCAKVGEVVQSEVPHGTVVRYYDRQQERGWVCCAGRRLS